MGATTLGVILLNVGAFGAIASGLAFGEFALPTFGFVILAIVGGYVAYKGSQKASRKGKPDRG